MGGAVERLGRQWRTREEIVHAVVEPHCVLCGVASSAATAGLVFGVCRLAEDNLVSIRSCSCDQGFDHYPAGDGFAGMFFIIIGITLAGLGQQRFNVDPVAAAFNDDEFMAASGLAYLCCVCVGSYVEGCFVHQRSALGVGKGGCHRQENNYTDNCKPTAEF